MALGTMFYVVAAMVQIHIMRQSARDASVQTDQLIKFARTQADAAAQNAVAASKSASAAANFAASARGINEQTAAAVEQFRRLATSSENSIRSTQAAASESLKKTIELSEMDRRPWVGLRDFGCNACSEKDNKLHIGDMFGVMENTGKTPAVDMVVDAYSETDLSTSPIPTFKSIREAMKDVYTIPSSTPPDIAASIIRTRELIDKFRGSGKVVLPPNATRRLPIVAGFEIDRGPEIRHIDNEEIVYVLGRITYYDVKRLKEYTTTFCLFNETGSGFGFCSSGNDMN